MEKTKMALRLAILGVCAAWTVCAAWDPGEPVTTYWAGPGFPGNERLSDRWLAQLKDGGFNTVWAMTPEELDLAAKYGMRTIYKPKEFCDRKIFLNIDDPASEAAMEAMVNRVKDHPALYVYELYDEPAAGLFAPLAHTKEWLARHDPNHAAWVNLLPTYANNEQLGVNGEIIRAYWEHVRLFGEIYRPAFLTYDHYQFQNGGDSSHYLLNLGIIRQNASALGVPFFNGVQACTWRPGQAASPRAPRIPGPDEMRYLVYTTAAYGAHGIYYYVYCHRGHEGSIVSTNGTPDVKYEVLKTLNREFIAIAKELSPLKFVGAYYQGLQAPGTTPYCEQALLKLTPETPAAELKPGQELTDTTLVTRFDAPGRPTHLMVVNLDYRKDRKVHVEAPAPAERFNAQDRSWSSVGSSFDLELTRGSGVLLRLGR